MTKTSPLPSHHATLVESAEHAAHHFLNWFSGVSACLSLAPFVFSALGIGKVESVRGVLDFNGACCAVIQGQRAPWGGDYSFSSIEQGSVFGGLDGDKSDVHGPTYGLAGLHSHLLLQVPGMGYHLGTGELPDALNAQLRRLPQIGPYMAEMKLANALAAGGVMFVGELAGNALDGWQRRQAQKPRLYPDAAPHAAGAATRLGAKGLGLFIALPTMFAGVGHAVQVITASLGVDTLEEPGIGGQIMALLGKPMGTCGGEFKASTGAATAGLLGLCCAMPAALAAVSGLLASHHRAQNVEKDPIMPSDALASPSISLRDSPLQAMVDHHHRLSQAEFEQQAAEVAREVQVLETKTAWRVRLGASVKWGARALGGVLLAVAGHGWLKRSGGQEGALAATLRNAEEKMTQFTTAKSDRTLPKILLNQHPAAQGAFSAATMPRAKL